MADLVPVRVRACACPDAPHPDGDHVYILPALTLAAGLTAEQQMLEVFAQTPVPAKPSPADLDAIGTARSLKLRPLWFETFIRHQAVAWDLPAPFSVDALLADYTLARPVGDACADRYSAAVLAPFQTPADEHSPSGPTDAGTPRPTTRTRSR